MAQQDPADLRERLLGAQDAGLTAAEIERTFGISARSLRRWRQWTRERGGATNRPRSGRPRAIPADQTAALRAQVADQTDATLAEHCARWEQEHGVRVSTATMSRRLAELGWSLKKRP
jgi:transposase